jgi:hypothetical protein
MRHNQMTTMSAVSCARGIIAPMRFRKLRIAVTVLSLAACLLLSALWVRSYWVIESIINKRTASSETTFIMIATDHGTLSYSRVTLPTNKSFTDGWHYERGRPEFTSKHRWSWIRYKNNTLIIRFPTLFPAVILYAVAAIPWLDWKRRFSLRTLLIATTLFAVVLGIVVAMST